jgi:mannose-1-phosphate guanylyltransferase
MKGKLALILAGGYGKRLWPFTKGLPKALIEVNRKPILYWEMKWLESHDFGKIIVLAGHNGKAIEDYLDNSSFDMETSIINEQKKLGTAGAIANARKYIKGYSEFLVVNGDTITNINVDKMKLNGKVGCIASSHLVSQKGILHIKGSRLVGFIEKPEIKDKWISTGVYKFSPMLMKYLPSEGDLEVSVFPRLVRLGLLGVTKFPNYYFHSIDSFKDVEQVNADFKEKRVL